MRVKMSPLTMFAFTAFLCAASACDPLFVRPLDTSKGTKYAKPIEPRQITGPKLEDVIEATGERLDNALESKAEADQYSATSQRIR